MPKGKGHRSGTYDDPRQNPIDNYIEWSEHRLNPGHYLGGTIKPDLRKASLGPRARRRSGIMLVLSSLSGLVILPMLLGSQNPLSATIYTRFEVAAIAAFSLLTAIAGVKMFRAGSLRGRGSKTPRK